MFFILAQKVTKYLGKFCKEICCKEISKLAQSGHTVVVYLVFTVLAFYLL